MMRFTLILISSLLFGGSAIKDETEAFIASQFADSVTIKMNTLKLDPDFKTKIQNSAQQAFFHDELYYWTISQNDSIIAYALMDNVLGKSMPITFLVILNSDGSILAAEVIKYREAYGGEVGNKSWLAQFKNRNHDSNYKVGKDIDGISGATISVNSMTKGIQKITLLFPLVKKQLK